MADSDSNIVEVLAEEFTERLRRGETPSISEYTGAHPEHADEIREALESIAMIEQLARRREAQRTLAAACRPPEQLGDFKIIRQIGRGGMGVVFEAEQVSLGRRVAVKVLPRHILLEPKQTQRFEREAQTAAKLHHTNIVPVFGVGQDEGYHYYVMQLIDGTGLDRVLAAALEGGSGHTVPRLPGCEATSQSDYWPAVARIGVQAADALAYAHAHGTLHRDIKPANLLLDGQGVVWITDFGLARAVEQDTANQTGGVVGTLRYMAPEQFRGQTEARSDIYSLGLTLYELLAMKPAYEDTNPSSLIRKISQAGATRLRKVNPRIPRDLETIVSKAAAHDPAHRYVSAAELAGDLRCFLEDRPIHAKRTTAAERAWRWGRRNPVVALLSAASVVLLVTVTALSTFGYLQLRGAYDEVDEALGAARRSEEQAVAAARQAQEERDRKQRETRRAESNLAVAMSAFDAISDRLASRELPQSVQLAADESSPAHLTGGLAAEDAELVQSLLKFYDQFAANNAAGAVVDFAAAKVRRRIGDIRARLGQYELAASAYDQAIRIADDLHDAKLPEKDVVLFRARTLNALGRTRRKSGDFRRALEAHRQAREQLESVKPEPADEPLFRYELALTLNDLVITRSAEFMHQQSRRGPRRPKQGPQPPAPPEIQRDFQRARDLLQGLVDDSPRNTEYLLALARCYRSILPVTWANHDGRLAATAKGRSTAILEQLADAAPDDPKSQYELADTLAMTPYADSRTPLSEPVVASLARSIDITARLNKQSPTAPEFAVLLANSHHTLGSHFIATKAWTDAGRHLTIAAGLFESLLVSAPANPLLQVSLARVRWELAESLSRQGSPAQARELLDKAIREYASFRASEAGRRTSPGLLVGLYRQLARTLEQLGEKQAAAEASRTADRLRDSSE